MAYIGRDIEQGTFTKQTFTADSSTTVFTLSHAVVSANNLLVSVGGVIQEPDSAYTASGTVLTFTGTPTTGDLIWVVYLGKSLTSTTVREAITKQVGVGDGTTTPITLSSSVVNSASIIVSLNGVVQVPDTDFVASGTTLTFTTAPSAALAILVYFLQKKARLGKPADGSVTAAKLASSGTLPAVDGSALTGIFSAADFHSLRTNIALAGFNRSTDHATTVLGMPNGFIDQFEDQTGVDDANSTNELYDTTGDYYGTSVTNINLEVESGNTGHTVTNSNVTSDSTNKKFGTSSAFFNGTSSYMSIPDHADFQLGGTSGGNFTVEYWQKSSSTTSSRVWSQFAGHPTENFMRGYYLTSEFVKVYIDSTVRNTLAPTTNISNNAWHHVALVRDGGTLRLFIDGTQEDTQVVANNANDISGIVYIGAHNGTSEFFSGNIDEFRLSNTARYTSNFTPSTVAYTSDANTQLLMHFNGSSENLTLISETSTASASPDNAHIALFNEEGETLTLDTDIMAWASRSKQTVTATNATNVLNATAHGLSNGDRVMLTTTDADLPAGLDSETVYHVVNKTVNTFKVSLTSGGAAVTFSDDGTGTHSVRAVTKAALVDRGDFETGKATLSALVDISGQPTGTDMSLIVQTKNNKATKLHGMSMQYT